MMKLTLILTIVLFYSVSLMATEKKEAVTDKVYNVDKSLPQIQIGPVSDSPILQMNKRPMIDTWHMAITRSNFSYPLVSFSGDTPDFSESAVGIELGRKIDDRIYSHRGSFEGSLEWQRFYREKIIGQSSFKQNINVFQMNLFQNFNMGRPLGNDHLLVTAGIGAAPVYMTSEKNVFTNSISDFGALAMMKINFIMPAKKWISFLKNESFDLSLKAGWGRVGKTNLSMGTIGIGLDFE